MFNENNGKLFAQNRSQLLGLIGKLGWTIRHQDTRGLDIFGDVENLLSDNGTNTVDPCTLTATFHCLLNGMH